MENFKSTLTILDNLIARLEANTGGCKIEEPTQKKVQVQKEANKQKPKEEEKKQKKQKAQKKQEGPKQEGEKKAKGEKKEKKQKPAEEKKQKQEGAKKEDEEATVEDFAKIDIRIGTIVEVWKHPDSEKLYCEKIDVCGEVREIASGLQQFVAIDDMKGPVIVMANLKPRPLAKFMSNGMVVCASNADHTDVEIIRPAGENSERVVLEGHQDLFKTEALLPVLNPKRKILQKCLPHFTTDDEGFVIWKGIRAKTSGGYLKARIIKGSVS